MSGAHDTARKMLGEGALQADIVRKTGLSRSAVAGMAHRLRAKGAAITSPRVGRASSVIHVPRARDEEILRWLRQRCYGVPVGDIALRSGVGSGQVSVALDAVRKADLAESDEDPAVVDKAYWRAQRRGRRK